MRIAPDSLERVHNIPVNLFLGFRQWRVARPICGRSVSLQPEQPGNNDDAQRRHNSQEQVVVLVTD